MEVQPTSDRIPLYFCVFMKEFERWGCKLGWEKTLLAVVRGKQVRL